MKTTFIYALCEPGTRTIRYIGKTNFLNKRFNSHINHSSKEKTHLGNWLLSLEGEKPILVILHEVEENEYWADEERRYISCARALGMDLVNATDGGEGAPGYAPTSEHRAAISAAMKGVPKSPEHCAAISAATKGRPKSPGHNKANSAARKGVPLSPAHCSAVSAAMRGRPKSAEHCAAMSASRKGVPLSPETCAALSAAKKGRPWSPARRAAFQTSGVIQKKEKV